MPKAKIKAAIKFSNFKVKAVKKKEAKHNKINNNNKHKLIKLAKYKLIKKKKVKYNKANNNNKHKLIRLAKYKSIYKLIISNKRA